MAKYAYAPVSVDGTRKSTPHGAVADSERDDNLVNQRMPMCVGICVLLAIVFVLSRTGGDQGSGPPNIAVEPPQSKAAAATTASVSGATVGTHQAAAGTSHFRGQESVNYANVNGDDDDELDAASVTSTTDTSTSSSSSSTSFSTSPYAHDYTHPKTPAVTSESSTSESTSFSTSPYAHPAGEETQPREQPPSHKEPCNCDGLVDPNSIDMGVLREKALASSPPHIIECAAATAGESQEACHLPPQQRFAALRQKGATLWMTGCSGAGKTTIATALEEKLVKEYGKHVYRLDGDNLRTGLNRDLGFSESDRAESVRRTGEIATLFADSGVITLVGLISPYRKDRDAVRKRHEEQGIPFYEIFLDVPIDELKKRDPKGQYERVESGELKHFTCIDDPYEEPLQPEIVLKTHENTIEQSVDILFRTLEMDGILEGAPKLAPPGLPNPDGDVVIDLHVPQELRQAKFEEAMSLPKVLITDVDLNWLQVIGEGWASPLRGFMREGTLLETLHFNSILVDPFNLTGNVARHETQTDFDHFPEHAAPDRVSMSIPITLSITDFSKEAIEQNERAGGTDAVALVTQMGQVVAILRNPEIYENRKEEIVTRMYGVIDMGHPYIQHIYAGGPYLLGGEVELLDRIRYKDGLDPYRLTASELMNEFVKRGADTVYAFQTRNPTHAGHAYLMKKAGEDLREQGYRKPILWLSPLGGWTKSDDVPLDVRVKQHVEVLDAGTTHPGGLDPETTVMAIWPAPMVYAGPTEVQFHAKSRRSAGASYFVVGRDPAGMKGSMEAVAHTDDDLYDGNHGRYVLQNSPGIGNMQMLSFVKVMYDTKTDDMKVPDEARPQDFISISGTKMRKLAGQGASLCPPNNIPTDLLDANCIPSGFMVPKGWAGVVDYYKNVEDAERWVPWSRPNVEPPNCSKTTPEGRFGSTSFQLKHNTYPSFWHDVPLHPEEGEQGAGEGDVINLVVEIPMYMTAKMEVQKKLPGNPIAQDTNKDGSPRYYTYGTPFFNYGLIPQTWEDPSVKSAQGNGGDNDPLDAMEVGTFPINMGGIRPCRVLGSLELIDEGETDHKIICISLTDPDAPSIHTMDDLERVKPGTVARLLHWLKRYKTSDGKGENALAQETPTSKEEALQIIQETNERWKALCSGGSSTTTTATSTTSTYGNPYAYLSPSAPSPASSVLPGSEGFWLSSPSCKGTAF